MKVSRIIFNRIVSLLLISIFAFGITPVIVLHNLFADHIDQKIQHHHTKSNEIANAGMDCHSDSFVAETNFISAWYPAEFKLFSSFHVFSDNYRYTFYSQHHFFAELRGPPMHS